MLDGGVDSLSPACLPEWVGVVGHFSVLDEVFEVGARVESWLVHIRERGCLNVLAATVPRL